MFLSKRHSRETCSVLEPHDFNGAFAAAGPMAESLISWSTFYPNHARAIESTYASGTGARVSNPTSKNMSNVESSHVTPAEAGFRLMVKVR